MLVQFCVNDLNDPTLHFDASTALVLEAIPDAAFPDPSARRPPPLAPTRLASACERLALCSRLVALFAGPAGVPSDAAGWQAAFAPHDGPEHRAEWRWLRARYREIADAAAARGARFAVLAFPYQTQIDADAARASAQPELLRIGAEEGWQTLDLLEPFRAAARRGSAPLLLDIWHPTAAGHRVAADAIARELACRGLLPIEPAADCGV